MSKYGYPSHLIPNSEKNRDWILAYVKAAHKEFNGMNGKIFYGARYTYATIRDYAMGTQSISKYKRMLDVSESENDSWLNIDWSILPVVSRFRRLALAKLSKRSYNITATPIDILSQEEIQGYKAKQEVKIKMRSELQKMNSPLANEGVFSMEEGEPRDMEELQIHMDFSFKHKLSEEIEEVIKNVLNINDYEEIRNRLLEDAFDFGVCGVKEYVQDGVVRLRHVRPENIITSYCMNRDFSDAQHIGELKMMSLADIRRQAGAEFSEEQFYDIAERFVNSFQNPSAMPPKRGVGADYDSFQIPVLDIEFISVNSIDIESRVDKRGNQVRRVFNKARKRKTNDYTTTHYKVVYKAKWILGTEYLFDYGLCTNMKRERSNMTETTMSYHLFAPEFYDMRATSIMEQVIPIADSIQLNWFKLQNAIAIARPKGIQIALDAIENIPLGSGGAELSPKDVLDLFNKKGTLVYRYLDPSGNPSPYKPIEEIENGLGRDVSTYYDLITRNMQMLRDITGLNEYVDGSSIDPRTLSNVTRLAEEASNNALFACVQADRIILERVAKTVIVRLQDLIKFGTYHPAYKKALGVETIKYISGNADFSYREFGIKIEDKPDVIEREKLKAMAGQYMGAGLIDFEDLVLIENSENLKKAQYILAYRLKKRKEEKLKESMLLQQQNAAVQQQSVAAKGEADIAKIEAQGQMKMELEKLKGEIEAQLEQIKAQLASQRVPTQQ
jgi:hypothetical protein